MRKGRYRCTRYVVYLPVSIGEKLDRSVDYAVRLFGPLIMLIPEGLEFSWSKLEKIASASRQNNHPTLGSDTQALTKESRSDP